MHTEYLPYPDSRDTSIRPSRHEVPVICQKATNGGGGGAGGTHLDVILHILSEPITPRIITP